MENAIFNETLARNYNNFLIDSNEYQTSAIMLRVKKGQVELRYITFNRTKNQNGELIPGETQVHTIKYNSKDIVNNPIIMKNVSRESRINPPLYGELDDLTLIPGDDSYKTIVTNGSRAPAPSILYEAALRLKAIQDLSVEKMDPELTKTLQLDTLVDHLLKKRNEFDPAFRRFTRFVENAFNGKYLHHNYEHTIPKD